MRRLRIGSGEDEVASESIEFEVEELLDTSDFTLDDSEAEKGGRAVRGYLGSIKSSDSRLAAHDNLEMLAILISRGNCDSTVFPWHQVRSFHSRAALSILREDGMPAQVETWRCQLDETRKFHQVSLNYSNSQIQKISGSLKKVLYECHELGFLSAEDRDAAVQPSKIQSTTVSRNRVLTDGEFRALASICSMDGSSIARREIQLRVD